MDMEMSNGYTASNGDCSSRKENSRMLVDLSTNTPNGQHSQSPDFPPAHQIKQEEGTEEETERRPSGPDETGHSGEEGSGLEEPMIDSPNNLEDAGPGSEAQSEAGIRLPNGKYNGDRPFQCNQCGVTFTQKGNLLRHIKLHTGEKPFKCPFCSYACRRRDALTGHLRTHSVGKPHKCNYCGRSYKQRTSLEEHKERCHNYLQSVGMDSASNSGPYPGEVLKEQRSLDSASLTAFDRPPVIERLQGNVGKRKSTTPQKFVGEKMVHYPYPELNYEMGLKFEKEAEMMQAQMMDHAISNAINYLGSDSLRPVVHHSSLSMAEVVPMVNPLFHPVYPLGPRMDRPSSREAPLTHTNPEFPHPTNGAISLVRPKNPQSGRDRSPCNSGQDSADSARSSPRDKLSISSAGPRSRSSSGFGRAEEGRAIDAVRIGIGDGVRVFSRGGQELRVFQCEHCRVLFLDHVMYTIHMGCHGYRDPLECNICGHCSKDRYEFSSHIVRGEHTFR
ncbi:zinc finger protein Helios-like isoform X1 [Myxocyprinus asiaticus]|uniref:zinc finger protein Helios-like isoform X1 n=1 Tax=Myxocyprinus asiaticus TaxID=70543 RepID=UPI0022230902|nr:zinc finger protein Helios-like isoform X1 [Myxocyprinus asiaticus]